MKAKIVWLRRMGQESWSGAVVRTFNSSIVGSGLWQERHWGLLNESSVLAELGCTDQELSWEMPPFLTCPQFNPAPAFWLAMHPSGITAVTSQLSVLLAIELWASLLGGKLCR